MTIITIKVFFPIYFFVFFNFIYLLFIYLFCCIAWGPSYTYMYTFFFLLLFCYDMCLDIVINDTQQELIVNPFQEQWFASNNPTLLTPPTPSLFP